MGLHLRRRRSRAWAVSRQQLLAVCTAAAPGPSATPAGRQPDHRRAPLALAGGVLVEDAHVEGQPDRVEAQQLDRVHDEVEVSGRRRAARPQAVDHGLLVVEAEKVEALERDLLGRVCCVHDAPVLEGEPGRGREEAGDLVDCGRVVWGGGREWARWAGGLGRGSGGPGQRGGAQGGATLGGGAGGGGWAH